MFVSVDSTCLLFHMQCSGLGSLWTNGTTLHCQTLNTLVCNPYIHYAHTCFSVVKQLCTLQQESDIAKEVHLSFACVYLQLTMCFSLRTRSQICSGFYNYCVRVIMTVSNACFLLHLLLLLLLLLLLFLLLLLLLFLFLLLHFLLLHLLFHCLLFFFLTYQFTFHSD